MKNRFLALAMFFIIAGSGSLSAQLNKIEFQEFDLDNGLHVILHQDNSTPIVAVSVMYNVGSKHEDPKRTGFAHFFEHLMFEGTENIARHEYSNYVERAGGTLNANTSVDRTYYYEILPSNQLELGMWLESERMMHAIVDSVGIATQKKVVIEEKKQNYDNRPYGNWLAEMVQRAYKVHPYKWTTIGDPEHIMAAKDEEFQQFYEKFYVPNNAVLVVAGDIQPDETKKLVNKYFSEIPKGQYEIKHPTIVEPPLGGEVRDTIYDNIQLPLIMQGYRTPAMGTDDYYALDMLTTLLSSGNSSRLHKALVDDQQKALDVSSFPIPYREPAIALIYGIPNMGVECEDLEAAIESEIDKVKSDLISEKEFQKLKNQMESNFVQSNEKIATRANTLARDYTYFNDANLINTELNNYLAVTREDIKRVANEYLSKDNRVVLYYLPKSQQN